MIYLASPLSHPDPAVMQTRFELACRATADLMRQGHHVFSPIAHSYPVATIGGFAAGWRESIGVQEEIKYAKTLQLPISYVDPLTLAVTKDSPRPAPPGR